MIAALIYISTSLALLALVISILVVFGLLCLAFGPCLLKLLFAVSMITTTMLFGATALAK